MGLTKEYKKELDTYDNPYEWLDELSIQEALTILTVYNIDLDPEDHRKDVEQIVVLLQKHQLFKEISEDEQSTLKRINRHLNMMQNEDYVKVATDRAVDILQHRAAETAFKLVVQICKKLGLTEARKNNLNVLAAKLSIGREHAFEIIQSV
jgi:hypothetical protein